MLKQAWLESGGVYGYRKLTLDMRDLGERCGKHRVAQLLKLKGLRSQTVYGQRPGVRGVCKYPWYLQITDLKTPGSAGRF
ncbi:transposase InsO family protein [Comamonas odontotermitis]|uniref:Transposase InsO family protein n=1 Tax=Comamonas odontotermitis TaxID=379895 RepID=A0ABR6RIX9_9BURK|nr:transposase InsO family protein [Comamonas odontotermitis]